MTVNIKTFAFLLLAFIPISLYLGFFTEAKGLTFATVVLSIVILAGIIGYATKEIILQTHPAFGGFLNATFGNAVELIIAVLALRDGLLEVVQASIVGSIINNLLLLIGLSIFFGGLRHKEQRFNKISVGVSSTMLIIAIVGLAVPTVYSLTVGTGRAEVEIISYTVAAVLALIYLAGLFFAFVTHKHLFDASDEVKAASEKPGISSKTAAIILLLATVMLFFESELLVDGFKYVTAEIGLTQAFLGMVVVAILSNIAEKMSAIKFATENKLDVSLEIGLSGATQIALFVVPVLVFVSHLFGYGFSLVFSPFDIVAVFFAVMIVNYLSSDGKCNWLEGAQLISVYLIIAIAYYFV